MDWTDVHFRQLARCITKRTWLWTEMVVDKTIIHVDNLDYHLWFPPEQRPIVLQVGGSDPDLLRQAAVKAAQYGYDEVNLNCGCPSDRVAGAGCFGATLMLQPTLVAQCVQALQEGLNGTPITVKCRLGVDNVDDYPSLHRFVDMVSTSAPVRHFIVHARKCLLHGLSPAQNRSVPPLRYHWVTALKRDFPHLQFTINGGFQSAAEAAEVLRYRGPGGEHVHGVMLGRAAYGGPWSALAQADTNVFGAAEDGATSRRQVLQEYAKYADGMLGRWRSGEGGGRPMPNLRSLTRPILNLFFGERGTKRWKNAVDNALLQKPPPASMTALLDATLHHVDDAVLDAPPSEAVQGQGLFAAEQTGEWPPLDMPVLPCDSVPVLREQLVC